MLGAELTNVKAWLQPAQIKQTCRRYASYFVAQPCNNTLAAPAAWPV